MAGVKEQKRRWVLDGDRVALDFANTVGGMRGSAPGFAPQEELGRFSDLISWAEAAKLLDKRAAANLYKEADQYPEASEALLVQARQIREAFHDSVLAALDGRPPTQAALDVVNVWIAEALAHRRLYPKGKGGFEARFEDDGAALAFLRPVALDAADLLERGLVAGRVRLCGESEFGRCGWLFLDQTKNKSRRFCSMTDCGNRAKQRRFQERRRGEHTHG
jgi:predicted RNA-binding Zn ribbon-like protein